MKQKNSQLRVNYQMWWLTYIILSVWEGEPEGLQQVQGHTSLCMVSSGQFDRETLCFNVMIRQADFCHLSSKSTLLEYYCYI